MLPESQKLDTSAEDLAREGIYRFLAAVVRGPYTDGWEQVRESQTQELVLGAAEMLGESIEAEAIDPFETSSAVEENLSRLISALKAPPEELRADYDRVFGLVVPKECPPYETEFYPAAETFGRSQQLADVAGFYRAFGISPARRSPERPDHLGLELEFMAFVLLKKRLARASLGLDPNVAEWEATCDRAQRTFFQDHLAWWVPSFASGLRRKARHGWLLALADVLATWIPSECQRLEIFSVLQPARPNAMDQNEEVSGCDNCPLVL